MLNLQNILNTLGCCMPFWTSAPSIHPLCTRIPTVSAVFWYNTTNYNMTYYTKLQIDCLCLFWRLLQLRWLELKKKMIWLNFLQTVLPDLQYKLWPDDGARWTVRGKAHSPANSLINPSDLGNSDISFQTTRNTGFSPRRQNTTI